MDEEKILQSKMSSWRSSDHYEWVTKLLKEEIDSTYVRDLVTSKAQSGETLSSEEIGDALKIEIQAALRIQSILDRLV
jgi:hypothetical protein